LGHNTRVAIAQHFIQELLARADIVEIVGRHVPLKKTGANFSGLCPFHTEKTPSFTVSPAKQFYHCFGCGKNGDAIDFLRESTGADFMEAVHDLAQQYGMTVPADERAPAERERAAQESHKRATLTDVLAKAGAAYRKHLKNSPRAIAYLKQRGVSGQVARDFGLGYAPEGWRSLASVFADYADPLLLESGLLIASEEDPQRRYDRFRDRIMFPIRSVKGEVIGFGGRVLGDEKPKYLNSPETPVFHKGRELYGLYEARSALRERGYALVTEGYMDVVALAQLGFANAVATLGTACTPEHVHKLFRFTDSVVFSFDGDAAGRHAAQKALPAALPLATDVRSVKFLFLPPEHDPDSFIRAEGAQAFGQAVQNAVPLSRFLLETAAQACNLNTAEGRAHLAANARPLWQLLPAGALAQQLLGEIAEQARLGTHELSELWGLARKPAVRNYQKQSAQPRKDIGQRPISLKKPDGAALPRATPNSRAQRALQIVLTEPRAWESLSQNDHELLCSLPPPHGPLFAWLDNQNVEYGPQPWSALRHALRGHEQEQPAVSAVESVPPDIENDPGELRRILAAERKQHLAQATRQAAEAGDVPTLQRLLAAQAGKPGDAGGA
jgi:DNA primase